MKKILSIFAIMLGIIGVFSGIAVTNNGLELSPNVYAADPPKTNILDADKIDGEKGEGVWYILNLIVTIMTFGVGIGGVAGIIIAGLQYITAADNSDRMAKAKKRIIDVVIGMAIYAVFWAALNWLLPGGIFHS